MNLKRISQGSIGNGRAHQDHESNGLPYAYDHFAEGESPDPPFICFPDTQGAITSRRTGGVYFKVSEVHIELYTDFEGPDTEEKLRLWLDGLGFFMDKIRGLDRFREIIRSHVFI